MTMKNSVRCLLCGRGVAEPAPGRPTIADWWAPPSSSRYHHENELRMVCPDCVEQSIEVDMQRRITRPVWETMEGEEIDHPFSEVDHFVSGSATTVDVTTGPSKVTVGSTFRLPRGATVEMLDALLSACADVFAGTELDGHVHLRLEVEYSGQLNLVGEGDVNDN